MHQGQTLIPWIQRRYSFFWIYIRLAWILQKQSLLVAVINFLHKIVMHIWNFIHVDMQCNDVFPEKTRNCRVQTTTIPPTIQIEKHRIWSHKFQRLNPSASEDFCPEYFSVGKTCCPPRQQAVDLDINIFPTVKWHHFHPLCPECIYLTHFVQCRLLYVSKWRYTLTTSMAHTSWIMKFTIIQVEIMIFC